MSYKDNKVMMPSNGTNLSTLKENKDEGSVQQATYPPTPLLVDKKTFDLMHQRTNEKSPSEKSIKTLKSLPYSALKSSVDSQVTNKTESFVPEIGPKSDIAQFKSKGN